MIQLGCLPCLGLTGPRLEIGSASNVGKENEDKDSSAWRRWLWPEHSPFSSARPWNFDAMGNDNRRRWLLRTNRNVNLVLLVGVHGDGRDLEDLGNESNMSVDYAVVGGCAAADSNCLDDRRQRG